MTTTAVDFDTLARARTVLTIESEAVKALADRLDARFVAAVDLIDACTGRIIVTGLGKSGIICRKIAATLAGTGTPALYLHPTEAVHGDLGVVLAGDVVLAVSHSGQTAEVLALVELLKRIQVKFIAMTGVTDSVLAEQADVVLDVGVDREACPLGLAPSASTTATLAMGDALAFALAGRRGFDTEDFTRLHPGGALGKRLLHVRHVMHTGQALPAVRLDTGMREAIAEMTNKGFGITVITHDDGRVAGIITDGDLRRGLARHADLLDRTAAECMTASPTTIAPTELATAALNRMEAGKITALLVVDEVGRLEGLVHLHDLWRTEMF